MVFNTGWAQDKEDPSESFIVVGKILGKLVMKTLIELRGSLEYQGSLLRGGEHKQAMNQTRALGEEGKWVCVPGTWWEKS